MTHHPTHALDRSPSSPGDREVRWAWQSLLFYLVSFVASFVVGEGLAAWIAHGDPAQPTTTETLAAGLPAIVVFAIPGVVTTVLGLRAWRHGKKEGLYAAATGAAIAIGFAALNLVSFVLVAVAD